MTNGAGLVRADAVRIPLRSGSVHLAITSPPYWSLRSYRDEGGHYGGQIGSEAGPLDFLRSLWAVMDETHRTLADDGSAWINLGDKYAGSGGHNNATLGKAKGAGTKSGRTTRRDGPDRYNQAADVLPKSLMGLPWRFAMGLIAPDLHRAPFEPAACWHDDGPGPCRTCPPRRFPQWVLRAEVCWSKPNGLPESVTDRPRRSHEQWFMFTKSGRYFAAVDEVREAQKYPDHPQIGKANHLARQWTEDGARSETGHGSFAGQVRQLNPLGKLPGSVKSVPSSPLAVPESFVSDDGEHWRAHGNGERSKTRREALRRELWELGEKAAADGRPLFVRSVDHFAAFPPEWPRWIIAGWSPKGICTACGHGRRPVVKKTRLALQATNDVAPDDYMAAGWAAGRNGRSATEAAITGYACACPDTSAPTRPAVVVDPFSGTGTVPMMARAMGRFGVGIDLSRDYNMLAKWRIFGSGHGEKALGKAAAPALPKRKAKPPARPNEAQLTLTF